MPPHLPAESGKVNMSILLIVDVLRSSHPEINTTLFFIVSGFLSSKSRWAFSWSSFLLCNNFFWNFSSNNFFSILSTLVWRLLIENRPMMNNDDGGIRIVASEWWLITAFWNVKWANIWNTFCNSLEKQGRQLVGKVLKYLYCTSYSDTIRYHTWNALLIFDPYVCIVVTFRVSRFRKTAKHSYIAQWIRLVQRARWAFQDRIQR